MPGGKWNQEEEIMPLNVIIRIALFCMTFYASIVYGDKNVQPLVISGDYIQLTVNPEYGGRVSSFKWRGQELLFTGGDIESENNWGSTFWLSPQKLWGWPPPKVIDSEPYTITKVLGKAVSMSSQQSMGVVVNKNFSLSKTKSNQVIANYEIRAKRQTPRIAAWEVSRIPKNGVAFFKATPDSVRLSMGKLDYETDEFGFVSVDLDGDKPEGKLIANSENGWLAWFNDHRLYVKSYKPVIKSDLAEDEGDIEIYISDKLPYAELEVQSRAKHMQAEESVNFKVLWSICELSFRSLNANSGPAIGSLVEDCIAGRDHQWPEG